MAWVLKWGHSEGLGRERKVPRWAPSWFYCTQKPSLKALSLAHSFLPHETGLCFPGQRYEERKEEDFVFLCYEWIKQFQMEPNQKEVHLLFLVAVHQHFRLGFTVLRLNLGYARWVIYY